MVDMLDLSPQEVITVDTQANIVAIANFCPYLEVRDSNNNVVVVLGWSEVYTLGYNKGIYRLKNTGEYNGRVCIFRQFIL